MGDLIGLQTGPEKSEAPKKKGLYGMFLRQSSGVASEFFVH